MYSNIPNFLTGYKNSEMTDEVRIGHLRLHMKGFQHLLKAMLDEMFKTGLYPIESHLLHHVVDDLERFPGLRVLDASPFERVIVLVKGACRIISQR